MTAKYLRFVITFVCVLTWTLFLAAAATAAPAKTAVVTAAEGLNVRSGPGTGHAVLTHAPPGAQLPVSGTSGDWVRVKLPSGQEGWVAGWYVRVKTKAAAPTPAPAVQKTAVVETTTGLNVRSGPGTDRAVVTQAAPGTRLPVTGGSGEWVRVKLATGQEGWVAGWYVRVESTPVNPAPVSPAVPADATVPTGAPPAGEEAVPPGTTAVVKTESVDIKDGPAPGAATVACAMREYELSVTARSGTWYKVEFAPGAAGWVPGDKVNVVHPQPPSRGEGQTKRPGARPAPDRLAGAVVVLDPGHGGADPGASGPTGYTEKEFNLAVALETARLLRAEGAGVILTRDTDIRLGANATEDCGARSRIANEHRAHVFVSIHANANLNRDVQGTSVYYHAHPENHTDCIQLARALQDSLVRALERRDRGLFASNLMVLRGIDMPGALVETAFISNPEEEALLKDPVFQKQAARGITAGIKAYFEG